MRHRLATPVALVVAVAVFAGMFAVSGSLIWSPILAVVAALGTHLMLDSRTASVVRGDDYAGDAKARADHALRTVRDIQRLARDVRDDDARLALDRAGRYVPELFDRVRANAPDSLYSTAARMDGHLDSVAGALRRYLDIQAHPDLYPDSARLQRDGAEAFTRFAEFAGDSVRLVNQGDIAQYRAHLDTVAPPKEMM